MPFFIGTRILPIAYTRCDLRCRNPSHSALWKAQGKYSLLVRDTLQLDALEKMDPLKVPDNKEYLSTEEMLVMKPLKIFWYCFLGVMDCVPPLPSLMVCVYGAKSTLNIKYPLSLYSRLRFRSCSFAVCTGTSFCL